MLTSLWNRATHARSSSPAPTHSSAAVHNAPVSASSPTPFTTYVLSRIPDEESQKLFALSFGECLRRDPDALEINFDEVHRWLGFDSKDNAVRLLKREIPDSEYVLLTSEEDTGPPNRASFLISFNQFEELMIAAQTSEGKKARKLVLLSKRILQDFIVAEQQQLRATCLAEQQQLQANALAEQALELSREAARANALQVQLESLRAQQQHLYCFKLFGDRYKCGIGQDVDRRIRQHRTTCPSGYLVCSVPITCKAMEKLFESVMKEHGAWIRLEEYELTGDESEIKSMFGVFARTEELLNTTPFDQYGALLSVLDTALRTSAVTPAAQPPMGRAITAAPEDLVQESDPPASHHAIQASSSPAAQRASGPTVDQGNPIKAWHDRCVTHTHSYRDAYTPTELYGLYCGVVGEAAICEPTFWSTLKMNNIQQKRSNGKRRYVRIKVLSKTDLDAGIRGNTDG